MARLSHSQSSDQPAPGAGEPHPASYHFDPKLGDPRAAYTPADVARPEIGRPEMPARFVVTVEGETYINTMWGKRIVRWRSEPGTPCVILGYWADGTVDLRWPAIVGAYRVEGRFPAWVIVEDPTAKMAGGGHLLMANDLDSRRPTLLQRALGLVSRLFRGG